jgi:hypothetical protein
MKTFAATIAAFLFALVISLPVQSLRGSQGSPPQIEWVAHSLKEMQTIKVGMTRGELMKVFTTEGGVFSALSRTYVYKGCLYFKVDVEFRPVGRPVRDRGGRVALTEAKDDVIMKISKPYLDWSIMD